MPMQSSKLVYHTLCVLLLLCAVTLNAKAGTPEMHIAPKPTWLTECKPYNERPSGRSIENGFFYALNERQIDVDRKAEYFHVIREIVSETGVQNGSQIVAAFDPSYERLDFHQITVWRDGKPQNRLRPGGFKVIADEQDFSKFIYQGSYTANYIIPDIRKGDRIEYAFTVTGRNPVFGNHFCQNIYLQSGQAITHQFLSVQYSNQHQIHLKNFNNVIKPTVTNSNGTTRYVWEDFKVQPMDDENSPAWYDTRPRIQFSEFNSWNDVINWANQVNPVATDLKGELAERIAKLKADAGGDKEKYFRSAVKTVQDEVRYMGIEIGEYSHRANRPEKVFAQRYGDCKDKALLLVSMLRANGIDAYMVLVNTDLGSRVDQYLPTSIAFNHAVVTANVNGKQVWVDATIAYQRGKGTDIYFPSYGKGLQLKPGNNALVNVTQTPIGKQICHEKYTVSKVNDKVRLEVTTTYTLNQADDMRSRLAESGLSTTEKNYLKYYAKTYPGIEKRDSLIVQDDEQKNVLVTKESYLISNFFKRDSIPGKYNAGFYADMIDRELPDVNDVNRSPVALDYPSSLDYTIEVSLPSGWNMEDSHSELKRDAYSFTSDYTIKGDALLMRYQFSYLKDFLPASKLPQVKEDIKRLRNQELSFSFSYTPGGESYAYNEPLRTNGWMMMLFVLVAGICAAVAFRIYREETPGIIFEPGASFTPLGGWLIIVLIGLMVVPLSLAGFIIDQKYFDTDTWHKFSGDFTRNMPLRVVALWGVVGCSIISVYSVFCAVLLTNKRDILPKVFSGYLITLTVFSFGYLLLSFSQGPVLATSAAAMFVLSAIATALWIPYLKHSERVEQTFIVPYPHHNFSYEG